MKTISIYLCILLSLLVSTPMNATPGKDHQEERTTYQSIYKQIISEPQKALALADSAEKQQLIHTYQANIIRSKAYARLKAEKEALKYALDAYQAELVQQDSITYMEVCALLSNCYIELSRQRESIEYATKAIQIARKLGNKRQEAKALLSISRAQNELSKKKESNATLDQAIKLLQSTENPEEQTTLLSLYFDKTQRLMVDKKYEEAIEVGKKQEQLIDALRQKKKISAGLIDMRQGYLFSILCEAYQLTGEKQKAAAYYRKFLQTDFAQKPQGKTRADRYLLLIKEYQKVINNTLEREQLTPAQDSITKDYLVMLNKLKNTYALMKDYQTAFHYNERINAISEQLYARDKENAAMELSVAYETKEKEAEALRLSLELRQRNTFLGASCGLILLLLVILWLIYRNYRIIKRKNKITVNRVNQLIACKNELQIFKEKNSQLEQIIQKLSTKEEKRKAPIQELSNEQSIFATFEELMYKEKLYLNPNLTREDILQRLKLDKNRFAKMIQENTGENFSSYTNNLRLEYSMQLMKQYPNYTLQAIAIDSGINNVRTLHRLFRNKMGMTPTEYKNALPQ